MKKVLLFVSILGLSACTAKYLTDPQAAFESVECETDNFNGATSCVMPQKNTCGADGSDSVGGCAGNRSYSKLKVVYNNGYASYAITGYVFNLGWTYPQSATDKSGKELKFTKTDSKVGACLSAAPCQTYEYFVIDINRAYIRTHVNNDIVIKIYGKRGNSMITLPAAYVAGFDAYLNSQGL